jgi:hypothetical protein
MCFTETFRQKLNFGENRTKITGILSGHLRRIQDAKIETRLKCYLTPTFTNFLYLVRSESLYRLQNSGPIYIYIYIYIKFVCENQCFRERVIENLTYFVPLLDKVYSKIHLHILHSEIHL